MAILAFQKPDKVLMLEADAKFGKFEFRPLEPGFGITVGNALRRILLSSLEGFAITIPDKKVLIIEIQERNGGRHFYYKLKNKQLLQIGQSIHNF